MYVYLTIMMSVAGPIKLQIKYVSNRSQHLETKRERVKKRKRETSRMRNRGKKNRREKTHGD